MVVSSLFNITTAFSIFLIETLNYFIFFNSDYCFKPELIFVYEF